MYTYTEARSSECTGGSVYLEATWSNCSGGGWPPGGALTYSGMDFWQLQHLDYTELVKAYRDTENKAIQE